MTKCKHVNVAALTDGPCQEASTVDVLHLRSNAQRFPRPVHRHVGVHSQLALFRNTGKNWVMRSQMAERLWNQAITQKVAASIP